MRIAIVNTTDVIGGAERCSFDLHRGLAARGHETAMVVGAKRSGDARVYECRYPVWDLKARAFLHYRLGLTDTTLITPFRVMRQHTAFTTADVVNLHNLHGHYWNFWTAPALARRMPVVLTLHDEWLYTGDCVYAYDCDRWRRGCGSCPQMAHASRPELGGRDFTRGNLYLKKAALRAAPAERVRAVSPSHWLAERTRKTALARFPVTVIPNGVDLALFRPGDRRAAKASFGVGEGQFCFLFLAANLNDPRKGFALLADALRKFGLPPGCVLLLAGNGSAEAARALEPLPVRAAGYLESAAVAECLAAADCMLLLSRADNLPYTAIEASACGCPALACDAGGVGEIVEDGRNGRLIRAQARPEELAQAMRDFAAMGADRWLALSRAGRERAEKMFSLDGFLRAYEALFAEAIDARRARAPNL